MKDRKRYNHPSYGQIRFSRVTGTNKFYGSELEQNNYISMEIYGSEVEKDLSNDWYYNTRMITRLRMTSNQFAELITSLNCGSGIPCTLEWYDKEKIESLPEIENRKELTHTQFKERMQSFYSGLQDSETRAKELIKKKTLSKQDQEDLLGMFTSVRQEINSNIPFFLEAFQETMDKVVVEAKSEVENAIMHKVTVLGLAELHKENKLLGDDN